MSDKSYLAKPSGDCCLKGNIHDGEPRGSTETIASIESYVAHPPEGKANGNIILYFPDVWGLYKNGLLLMDAFADAGYLTVGLDYFRGDPVWKHRKDRLDTTTDPGFNFEAWKGKHMAFAVEAVPGWVLAVKDRFGKPGTKFACVGYCFGAPFVCDELAKDVCTAGAFAHPAFLEDRQIRAIKSEATSNSDTLSTLKVLEIASGLITLAEPLLLSCAEIDHTFPAEARRKAVDMLIEDKKSYHLQLFGGVEHGFALRGDQNSPYERWVKEQSLRGMVEWFDLWLGQ